MLLISIVFIHSLNLFALCLIQLSVDRGKCLAPSIDGMIGVFCRDLTSLLVIVRKEIQIRGTIVVLHLHRNLLSIDLRERFYRLVDAVLQQQVIRDHQQIVVIQ